MIDKKPWDLVVLQPRGLDRDDADRLVEAAGTFSRFSHHATGVEARAEGQRILCKLAEVNEEVKWAVAFRHSVEGHRPEPKKWSGGHPYRRPADRFGRLTPRMAPPTRQRRGHRRR